MHLNFVRVRIGVRIGIAMQFFVMFKIVSLHKKLLCNTLLELKDIIYLI